MDNNFDCQFFGHNLHGAMLLDMAQKMHAEASFESANAFGCLDIIRYFIPQIDCSFPTQYCNNAISTPQGCDRYLPRHWLVSNSQS